MCPHQNAAHCALLEQDFYWPFYSYRSVMVGRMRMAKNCFIEHKKGMHASFHSMLTFLYTEVMPIVIYSYTPSIILN